MDIDEETALLLREEFQYEFFSPQRDKNLSDSILARQLQEQFEQELKNPVRDDLSDSILARRLQEQFQQEEAVERPIGNLVYDQKKKKEDSRSLVDPSWEVVDPTPDIHVLFMAFNSKFFWSKLDSVCVSWSTKMKRCAGVCSYQGRGGLCHITLSEPLLKLRPRKDLIETLLHEMIHAFLFVTHNNRDRDGHGPEFHKHMYRINAEAGTNITVYHDFHDEVELYLQHWWRCDGPCQKWKPYFGIVRRSVNRAPGPHDRWWGQHSRSCGGTYTKIKSPEPKKKETKNAKNVKPNISNDIRKFLPTTNNSGKFGAPSTSGISQRTQPSDSTFPSSNTKIRSITNGSTGLSTSVTIQSKTNNIHGFSNNGLKTGSLKGVTKNTSSTIVINKKTPSENNKPVEGEKRSNSIEKKPSQSIAEGSNTVDYSVVRNHWVKKFSNNNQSGMKRKSVEIISPEPKTQKLSGNSPDSLDCNEAACPVCEVLCPIEGLNEHLDKCLLKRRVKECIVCMEMVDEPSYEQHVAECVKKTFDRDDTGAKDDSVILLEGDVNMGKFVKNTFDDSVILLEEDSMDVNTIKCETCDNDVLIDDIDEHTKLCKIRNRCPECGKTCETDNYDVHLAECLMKKLDELDEKFKNNDTKNVRKSDDTEMISCLVCSRMIKKSDVNSHLDDCLCSVFDKKEAEETGTSNDDKMYNCPFCLKLFTETAMSSHIDGCLNSVDEDAEVEMNKNVFLSEMD